MKKRIYTVALALTLAAAATAHAQQFDRNAYNEMVDSSAPDTISPGTRITRQNWIQYRRFMPTWLQVAFSGNLHFHIGDTPEYVIQVGPTGNYPMPKSMRQDSEKYAGQTQLVPDPQTGGFTWSGYQSRSSVSQSRRTQQGGQDHVRRLGRILSAVPDSFVES